MFSGFFLPFRLLNARFVEYVQKTCIKNSKYIKDIKKNGFPAFQEAMDIFFGILVASQNLVGGILQGAPNAIHLISK